MSQTTEIHGFNDVASYCGITGSYISGIATKLSGVLYIENCAIDCDVYFRSQGAPATCSKCIRQIKKLGHSIYG